MKQRGTLTPLGEWLLINRVTSLQFAAMMANHLCIKVFSSRTVEKWRIVGGNSPTLKNRKAIKALTGISADQMDDAA